MKKINLLAGETSSGSSSTTISNLGLIQLKPLLDIEPKNEIQELYPGDDGVSGYSFIRIKGVNNQDNKVIDPSVNEQTVTPDAGFLGMKQVTINGVTSTIDNNIIPENIKKGVTILGVEGVCESTNNQEKTIAKSDLINNTNKTVTGELVHDADFTGMSKITYTKVNLNNNFTVEFRTPSDDKFSGLNLNVPVAGFDGVSKLSYKTRRQDKTVTPSVTEQTINCDSGYVGIRSVTVNPVTSAIDSNIKPENIVKGVNILGVEGTFECNAGEFEMNISSATVHNTYSGNGEERPVEDRSSTLRYRYRIGFFDENNNGCLSNLLGIIYSVNDNRSNDVYLYAKDFSNHLALGTDKRWRSVYIYSDTPFNNVANLHVYFFYKDNKVPQFAFYGDQHIENYFLNNSYLLNLNDNNSIGQYTYGQIAQYPKPEFPESSLNGLNSWVNVYNKTMVPISFIGIQEVSNFNFGDTTYIQPDNSFIGNSTIAGNHLDNSTLSPMAYKLVSNKDSKPTFLCNVNSGTGHICSFYTNNDKYTADISEYSTNVSLSYSETMSNKACTITNVDDIIVGSNVSVLSIKFGGYNYNPQRIFILRTSGFDTLTLVKDGDLSNTNIELVVPDSYSHNEVKSKLEEIGYTVTVNKLSTTDNSSQRYYFYTTNYGRHNFFMNDVADYSKYDSYHLSVKTSGSGVATDETDSKYVDISKFTYKKRFAAVDITTDIDIVGFYTDNINNITIVNNSENYKIVVQDDSTVWMYANNIMDSSNGYTILLHYKTDNPRIKEFSFFNLSNVTEFVAFKPMTLGYCSFYHDNMSCSFIGNARLVNVEALALFGFSILNFETNNLNYAACGTRSDLRFYNVRVINYSLDETDYTQTINNSGKLTVDLSPVFVLGNMSNSSWASLSDTYSCSHVNFVFGTDARKISNRNQILDIANYSDEGGLHEYDLDISEIPADKYSQSIVLNNIGQVINGNRCITETYTRMLNLFIPLNSRFRFEGTFSETQLRNDATHITNVVMFNPPENNTFHNGFSHSVGNEQVLKFYYDEQYDITNFKTTIETEFDNVKTEFHPMTIICDNLKDCRYVSGKNYGFVHSSRKRHSLIVVP